MAGIYIHIPFCKKACHYCNFHFSTSLKLQNDFLVALLKEIGLRKNYTAGEPVHTIYFGGGTPSLLGRSDLQRVMEALYTHYPISEQAEITLEANPDDIQVKSLLAWRDVGINRLSIGVQSFFEEDLQWMNRAHSSRQAADSIRQAQDTGFSNLSIDLIYGTPGLSDARWESNMQQAAGLSIPHLSCYALTVEPGTALDAMTRKQLVQPVQSDDQARQFLMLTDFFRQAGYEHYEISNLALPGRRSRHNSAYWSGEKYLGLGPSAHSFNGVSRQWNVANNALYIQSLAKDTVPFEQETLTDVQRFNEYVMTALRKMEGIDLQWLADRSGQPLVEQLVREAKKFIDRGWVTAREDRLVLTREGKLFADHIASALFA